MASGEEMRCRWRAGAAELSAEAAAALSAAVPSRRLGKQPVGRRISSW
jgi:hypothetical protein